MFIELKFCFL